METTLIILAVFIIFMMYLMLLWILDSRVRRYEKRPGIAGFVEGFVDAVTESFFERKSLSLHLRFLYGLYPILFLLSLFLLLAIASNSELEIINTIPIISKNVSDGIISLILATFKQIVAGISTLFSQ